MMNIVQYSSLFLYCVTGYFTGDYEYSMMKMLYTNESHFLVRNVQNIIEAQGIYTFLKNEFAQGAVGEIPVFDSWPEVWVFNESDYGLALKIIETSVSNKNTAEWICIHCSEKNDPSFEICWHCQRENYK